MATTQSAVTEVTIPSSSSQRWTAVMTSGSRDLGKHPCSVKHGYPSTPSPYIHPIFCRQNFLNIRRSQAQDLLYSEDSCDVRGIDRTSQKYQDVVLDAKTYSRMSKALTLASIFLRLSIPFFCKLLHADRVIDRLTRAPLLDPEYSMCIQDQIYTQHVLKCVSGEIFFFFSTDPECLPAASVLTDKYWQHRVRFGNDFWGFFSRANFDTTSIQTAKAITVYLATILVHELGHVVRRYRRLPTGKALDRSLNMADWRLEPKFSTIDIENEIGRSWQTWGIGSISQTRKPLNFKRPQQMYQGQSMTEVNFVLLTWEIAKPTEKSIESNWRHRIGSHLEKITPARKKLLKREEKQKAERALCEQPHSQAEGPSSQIGKDKVCQVRSSLHVAQEEHQSLQLGKQICCGPTQKDVTEAPSSKLNGKSMSIEDRRPTNQTSGNPQRKLINRSQKAKKKVYPIKRRRQSVGGSCYLYERISLSDMETSRPELSFQEDIYDDILRWHAVADAFEAGEIELSIANGSYATFQEAYLAVHGKDDIVRMYAPSKKKAWEAPF